MNKIETLIKEFCPDGVEWKEIGDVIDYEQPTKYLVSSKEYSNDYSLPVLTAGQSFILGYTNETEGVFEASKEHPVIIFDDFTTSKKWVNFNFKVKSTAMKILKVKSGISNILIRFVWHYLGTITYSPDQHGRQWISTYSKFKIPVPPLEIQEEIVKILDKFTDYVTELTTELTLRQKQYNYYRDKLLSFENEDIEWMLMPEVAKDFGRGKSKHRPRNDSKLYGGTIPFVQTGDIRNSKGHITDYSQTYSDFGLKQSKIWGKGTLCITIAANIAEMGILDFDACFPDSVVGFIANEEIVMTKFVAYYLESIKEVLASKSTGSAQENLNLASFSNLKIPVPSLERQLTIVKFLDNFDTICNDIYQGLPKEIELRQKQYEYYRDKLLTFD